MRVCAYVCVYHINATFTSSHLCYFCYFYHIFASITYLIISQITMVEDELVVDSFVIVVCNGTVAE